ncbi:adenylyl-sulfate kinase [Evansella tamaricis]|uniref:Adenylyl-sulfate kinase n=1 Tax=Evansella tamaricis TaxID=2069301 RepID=A0ABS6JI51_9BACI|nr:adenylyl-sulfate kinase [Evansella tamaricis]MBU9713316.1 adenylyl-sulfate kinase [Evansella tamaricis]
MNDEKNIFWHQVDLQMEDYKKLKGHTSLVVWLTGLSGSGKSTIANHLERLLYSKKIHTFLLDGDNLRHGINKNLDFNPRDRKENIRRIAEVSRLFVDAGIVTIVAAISPFQSDRDMARRVFRTGDFIEVFVDCSLDECENRDPKGLYKKARSGEIEEFTGISQPYEKPKKPEITVNTEKNSINKSVDQLMDYLIPRIKGISYRRED